MLKPQTQLIEMDRRRAESLMQLVKTVESSFRGAPASCLVFLLECCDCVHHAGV